MKFHFGTPGWGGTMWGIGYRSAWFIGFSRRLDRDAVLKYPFSDADVPNVRSQGGRRFTRQVE